MTDLRSLEGISLDSSQGTFLGELQQASELVVRLYEGLGQARLTLQRAGWRSPRCLRNNCPRIPSQWGPSYGKWRARFSPIPPCT